MKNKYQNLAFLSNALGDKRPISIKKHACQQMYLLNSKDNYFGGANRLLVGG